MSTKAASAEHRRKNVARIIRADKVLAHGLPALILGGALLIAAVWWVTLHLASTLAATHVQQKMADVAHKASDIYVTQRDEASRLQALGWLARFRDVRLMELRGNGGKLLWRNVNSISRVRRALPAAGHTLLERRNVDGLPRVMARHHALLKADGKTLHLVLEADVSDLMASYRRIAVLLAKAISTVLLAAVFMMGWLIILRWREQRELAHELRALLARGEQENDGDWRQAIDELGAHNATLLRRMLSLGAQARQDAATQHAEPARERRRA